MTQRLDTQGYTWRYVVDVALQHKRTLVVANVVAILAVIMSVPIPMLMPLLVDEVLLNQPSFMVTTIQQLFPTPSHGPVLYVLAVLLLTVCLRISSVALNVWQTREFTLVAKEISYRMRRELLRRLERVSMSEYETLGSGAVASRFVTDINDVDEFVGQSISKLLIAILSLVGVTVILIWMHWPLALFILLANPFVVYLTTILGKKVKTLKSRENRAFEIFQQSLTETLDAIQQIRAANREKRFIGHVIDKALGVKTDSAAFFWKSDAANRASFGALLVGFDIFRAVSMLMVVFSDLTIGQMLAVFAYLWFMMGPVQEVLNIQYGYYGAKAALARVNELLDLRDEPSYPHRANPFDGKTTVGISVSDIHFSYIPEEPVLNGVTLDIEPGEKVALVGASGGGKSTLVQVLIGLYIPQRGSLCFDGVPVTDIGLDVVRDNVATVLQHPAMLNDSVRANLTLGRPHSDSELWLALDIAQLKDVVTAMPDGLETIIGRQGLRLSGGQQQRLAIARMALTDPKVLILDEATSALDNDTEYEVHKALGAHFRDRTTLIIAHRLSAVKQADRVYVFEYGRIIEQGSHAELIDANGLYRKLYGASERA